MQNQKSKQVQRGEMNTYNLLGCGAAEQCQSSCQASGLLPYYLGFIYLCIHFICNNLLKTENKLFP